jgi:hypothetical protein
MRQNAWNRVQPSTYEASSSSLGSPDALYFTAGGADEDIGVFGRITPLSSVPEPSSFALLAMALAGLITSYLRKLN